MYTHSNPPGVIFIDTHTPKPRTYIPHHTTPRHDSSSAHKLCCCGYHVIPFFFHRRSPAPSGASWRHKKPPAPTSVSPTMTGAVFMTKGHHQYCKHGFLTRCLTWNVSAPLRNPCTCVPPLPYTHVQAMCRCRTHFLPDSHVLLQAQPQLLEGVEFRFDGVAETQEVGDGRVVAP